MIDWLYGVLMLWLMLPQSDASRLRQFVTQFGLELRSARSVSVSDRFEASRHWSDKYMPRW